MLEDAGVERVNNWAWKIRVVLVPKILDGELKGLNTFPSSSKTFSTWIGSDLTFKKLLADACNFFGINSAFYTLQDESGTIYSNFLKVAEGTNKDSTVYIVEKEFKTKELEVKVEAFGRQEGLSQAAQVAGLSLFKQLWNVFTFWNASFNPTKPFHMTRTSFIAKLRRCKLSKDKYPTTILELAVMSVLVPKAYSMEAGRPSTRYSHGGSSGGLNFAQFCYLLFEVATNLSNDKSSNDISIDSRGSRFVKFLETDILAHSNCWNAVVWQHNITSFQRDRDLHKLILLYRPGLKQVYQMMSDSGPFDYETFCSFMLSFGLATNMKIHRDVVESFLEGIEFMNIRARSKYVNQREGHELNNEIGKISTQTSLSFSGFLYALVRLSDVMFRNSKVLEAFQVVIGGATETANQGTRLAAESPLSNGIKFKVVHEKLSKKIFQRQLCVKFFILTETLIQRINHTLATSQTDVCYNFKLVQCSEFLRSSSQTVYRSMIFNFESTLNLALAPSDIHLFNRERSKKVNLKMRSLRKHMLNAQRQHKSQPSLLDIFHICNTAIQQDRQTDLSKIIMENSMKFPIMKNLAPRMRKRRSHEHKRSVSSTRMPRRHASATATIESPTAQSDLASVSSISSRGSKSRSVGRNDDTASLIIADLVLKSPRDLSFQGDISDKLYCLKKGVLLWKHTRGFTGSSLHQRFFWIDNENQFLYWTPIKQERSIWSSKRGSKTSESKKTSDGTWSLQQHTYGNNTKKIKLQALKSVYGEEVREFKQRIWGRAMFQSQGSKLKIVSEVPSDLAKEVDATGITYFYPFTLVFEDRNFTLETTSKDERGNCVAAFKTLIQCATKLGARYATTND